ncbi:MAG: cyclic peptide export ABC transporter [Planctomycetota bacterium]
MNLIWFLLRASWPTVLLACLVGGASGGASVMLLVLILRRLRDSDGSPSVAWLFACLCAVILLTRIGSQMLLYRLTQGSISHLRMTLCRRILAAPARHLEEIGSHRLIASLTGDVSMVGRALNGVPVLVVNFAVLAGGAVYLGFLSPILLVNVLAFLLVGIASYWYFARQAHPHMRRTREAEDELHRRIRDVIDGGKLLRMHGDRRRVFVEELTRSDASVRDGRFVADSVQDAAIAWGRLTFFIAVGLLLFVWPRIAPVDSVKLTGYTLTILYLMAPLEQVMGWVPFLGWASTAAAQVEKLGLLLDRPEDIAADAEPIRFEKQIELRGVTHAYRAEGQPHGFVLGPIDLTIRPGEVLFVVGGNGSGKTTLAKLLTGLYVPEAGEIRADGQAIAAANRESYRQLFSAVFDDAVVLDRLWGLESPDLDQRARDYLVQIELDRLVAVTGGVFSTTDLSRGQRKRLALLTAFLENRPIYVFDEWAADQDPEFRRVFYMRLLPDLKRNGKTVVAITHDDRYFAAADRVIKLDEGKVVDDPCRHPPQ